MKHKDPRKSLRGFLKKNGFYVAMVVLVAAGAVASYYAVMSLVGVPKTQERQETEVSQPVLDEPVLPQDEPEPDTPDAVQPAPAAAAAAPVQEPLAPVYTRPVPGAVLVPFSGGELIRSTTMNDWRTHNGTDYAAALGDAVVAVYSGEVLRAETDPLLGCLVELRLDSGYTVLYANLAASDAVQVGQRVSQGDTLGAVGATALVENAEKPHLHFELRTGTTLLDPETTLF